MIKIQSLIGKTSVVLFICWLCIFLMQPVHASASTNDVVVIESPGTYPVTGLMTKGACFVRVRQDEEIKDSNDKQDNLIMEVLGPDKAPLAELRFVSSYGIFKVELIDLDGDGNREFVLIVGEGRGPGACSEDLWILRLHGRVFNSIVKTSYSGYSGGATGGVKWSYDHHYEHRDKTGQVAVVLTLNPLKPLSMTPLFDPDDIPQERTKTFELKARSARVLIDEYR